MLKGDIGLLAKKCSLSKTTIYRIAEKINLDLKPIDSRCSHTVDFISGASLSDEQTLWLEMAVEKILAYRREQRDRRAIHKAMDKKSARVEMITL